MASVYSVTQVNSYIKNMFTQDYALNKIYIKGEVSNCKYHTSGHIYFTLKDETGTLACVMFAGQRKGLAFRMQEGQQVIAMGSISVYERDGKYQLYAKEIVLDGAGELYQRFEKLKIELEEMGMFAPEYKQAIPKFVKKVGIVTAPTGAAIQDIRNIATRRNPYVQLILYPALVQGDGAKESIVKGIETLDKYGVDVIIIGRGGGSIEDLWAFNEEMVARAIFECNTPIISAVGHETDFTIADFVADMRAPTPSAAAELAIEEFDTIIEQFSYYKRNLDFSMKMKLTEYSNRLEKYKLNLKLFNPITQLNEQKKKLEDYKKQIIQLMEESVESKRHKLSIYIERINGLSPTNKLNQGYAHVADKKGNTVNDIDRVNTGDELVINVANGIITSTVTDVKRREL